MKKNFLILSLLAVLVVPGWAQLRSSIDTARALQTVSAPVAGQSCPIRMQFGVNASQVLVCPESGTMVWTALGGGGIGTSDSPTLTGAWTWSLLNAAAVAIGPNGNTNPTFRAKTNTASAVTGIEIEGLAAGNGAVIRALSSGTNENLILTPKGTGSVLFPNGTVGNPAISFLNDTSSGWYRVGTADFAFSNNGNQIFRFTSGFNTMVSGQLVLSSGQDAGIVRSASGVVRVTNGSSGAGRLLLGTSSDTSAAQLDVRSQTVGVPAGQFQAASGESSSADVLVVKDGAGANSFRATAGGAVTIGANSTGSISLVSGWLRFGGGISLGANDDAQLGRLASHSIRIGPADAATVNAQTLSVQSVATGTSNTAGANWTFAGSRGTGTGAGGDIIFQTAPLGSTGSTQNTLFDTLRIKPSGQLIVYNGGGTARALLGASTWDNSYMSFQNAALAESAANSALNQNVSGTTILNAASGQTLNLRIGNVPAISIASDLTATFSDKGIALGRTITSTGTTGAQTINKSAFSVNFAAAATSLVVTNSVVAATSGAICQVMTNDTTMKHVQAVAGSGTLTLYPDAAPTAETKVYCEIRN